MKLVHPHILCIGDVMLDCFVYGKVGRISPEAPIPILHKQRTFQTLGGAGNVVRNLVSLEAKVEFITVVGKDEIGDMVRKIAQDICHAHVFRDDRITSHKKRFVSNGQQLLRVDDETTQSISLDLQQKIIDLVSAFQGDIIILSDYGKGVLAKPLVEKIISIANTKGIKTLVDPKGNDYTSYVGAYLLTPNHHELAAATGLPTETDNSVVKAAKSLKDFPRILTTRGSRGMILVTNDTVHNISSKAEEVFDVSGAGDSVMATLALALGSGMDLQKSCELANHAGAIVVAKAGTAVVTRQDLYGISESKVQTLADVLELVQLWRLGNLKIGFTNGCFDLLHLGHLHILRQASAQCDKLIVAVNSDTSVKKLKGPSRPIHDEQIRAQILAELQCVDAVIIFSQETPLELIKVILPDVLIKGADYTVEQVVGGDIVRQNGGKVFLAELLDGHSTTNTLRLIG